MQVDVELQDQGTVLAAASAIGAVKRRCPGLTSFAVRGVVGADALRALLSDFFLRGAQLRLLDLSNSNVDDEGLVAVADGCGVLTGELRLINCASITDRGIDKLAAARDIQALSAVVVSGVLEDPAGLSQEALDRLPCVVRRAGAADLFRKLGMPEGPLPPASQIARPSRASVMAEADAAEKTADEEVGCVIS